MFDASLAFRAALHPRDPAVITPRRRVSYAEFDADVDRFAVFLREQGVSPDRGVVAVGTGASYRRAVLLMALARLGVASTVVADEAADLRVSERPGPSDARNIRLDADTIARVAAAPHVRTPSAPRDLDQVARITLSSGTTGVPKRIPQTWRHIQTGGLSALTAYASGKLGVWSIRTGLDSSLGFNMAVLAWSLGAAVALELGDDELPGLMEQYPSGLIGLTPFGLANMVRHAPPGFSLKPDWRILVTGGLLAPAHARAARERLTPDIQIIYGSTEAGRSMVGPAHLTERHPGAVGYAVPGVAVEVVDAEDRPLPDGETGVIRIRSPRTTGVYVGDEAAASKAFRDGWFYPGDLGRRLPDGVFVIDGRADDRMVVGTVKVMPAVLENALLEHPQVRDCAAFSIPDAAGFEECWIAVAADGVVTRDELMARLERSGAPNVDVRFAWTDDIPRNAMGKADREALRALTQAALAKSAG